MKNRMNKEDIKEFLQSKRGYLKEGARRLKRTLVKKGFNVTIEDCAEALRECRAELKGAYKPKRSVKRLFFDIETSPNVMLHWRSGYNMNLSHDSIIKERAIICVSYKWENDSTVYNLKWDNKQCDRDLLKKLIPVIEEADEVIAHNGDGFDIKWIAGRALYHRIPFPAKVRTLDTLKKARAQFNLNSNKLDYIAKFLGFDGKLPTGFKLWKDLMLTNCPKAMNTMLEYCDEDVRLLERVYHTIQSYIKPNLHIGALEGKPKHTCPNCGSNHVEHIKDVFTAGGNSKAQMKCYTCLSRYEISMTALKKMNE